jgi:hypothetical protein
MAKKYQFNQQSATLKLRESINEGRVMFTIDDEDVDHMFMNDFEADVDYIHDGPDVYYVTDQNQLERFVDYIESRGLNGDAIQVQQYFKEEGSVTGGEAYLPAMDVSSKKQNPFKEGKQEYFVQVDVRDAKNALAIIDDSYSLSNSIKKRGTDVYTTYDVMAAEELIDSLKQNGIKSKNNVEGYVDEDVLSGYTQIKNFRPGHTTDKGGFQYKDLWGLNESADDLEPTKQKVIAWSRGNRNEKQDSLAIQWFKEFEDAVMNATTKQGIRDAVLDMYYADDTILDKLGLLDLDYDDSEKSTDPLMKKSTSNEEELQRVKGLLDRANQEKSYSVMSSYEDKIKKLKFLVSLEKKINDKLPLLNFGDLWADYAKNKLAWNRDPNKFADIAAHVQRLMEPPWQPKMEILREMNNIVDEVFSPEDYKKVLQVIEKIKYTNTRLYNAILDMISDIYPHNYGEVEAQMELNESMIPDNIVTFAKRKGVTALVKKVASWAQKAGKRIVGGTAIGKGYNTLILDLTYQGGEIRINLEDETISVNGEDYIYDYDEFINALGTINENYSRFKNETKTRTKPEQFHQAVKSVKRKVEEINKLYEYMERLKLELSEGGDNLKYKKYTENAIFKIKEAVKALHIKTKKLK